MEIPDAAHPIWRDIVKGRVVRQFEHLGVQLFLGRARVELLADSSPQRVESLARELRSFVLKNQAHPKVMRDIARITGAPSEGGEA